MNNKNLNQIKNYLLIGFIILLFISIIIIVKFKINKRNDILKNDNNSNYVHDDIVDLPNLYEIDRNKNPMLYDFVNCSMGYYFYNDLIDQYTYKDDCGFLAILKPKDEDIIFVESYQAIEKVILPLLGNKPIKIKLNETNIQIIKDREKQMDKNRIFEEGNYILYIIRESPDYSKCTDGDPGHFIDYDSIDNSNRWFGIDISNSFKTQKGNMYDLIYNQGIGFPTDWLRRDSISENLYKNGVDIKNDFFDSYNLYSKIYFIDNINNNEIELYVDNLNKFTYFNKDLNTTSTINLDQLNMLLKLKEWSKD